ncbi:MAG: antibiotic biosynthesis monooxygenase [Myxococcota bacterium]
MSEAITLLVESRILEGQRAELEALLVEVATHVAANEPGNEAYDWYCSSDDRCVVIERYADSEAVLAHVAGYQKFVPRLDACREQQRIAVLGKPEGALAQVAEARGFEVYDTRIGKE